MPFPSLKYLELFKALLVYFVAHVKPEQKEFENLLFRKGEQNPQGSRLCPRGRRISLG
jgi:hypothetical protein